jgi:hypothetical protein
VRRVSIDDKVKKVVELYQVPEMSGDHELQSFRGASRITGNHRVARHNSVDRGRMWVKTLRRHLLCGERYEQLPSFEKIYPEREILCGENPAQALLFVDHKHAIRSFCRTKLTRFGDRKIFWHC